MKYSKQKKTNRIFGKNGIASKFRKRNNAQGWSELEPKIALITRRTFGSVWTIPYETQLSDISHGSDDFHINNVRADIVDASDSKNWLHIWRSRMEIMSELVLIIYPILWKLFYWTLRTKPLYLDLINFLLWLSQEKKGQKESWNIFFYVLSSEDDFLFILVLFREI